VGRVAAVVIDGGGDDLPGVFVLGVQGVASAEVVYGFPLVVSAAFRALVCRLLSRL
jgi:hypothetical protein